MIDQTLGPKSVQSLSGNSSTVDIPARFPGNERIDQQMKRPFK